MKASRIPFVRSAQLRLLIIWGALVTVALACQPPNASGTEQISKATSSLATDSASATQTVLAFLTWYKNHIQAANAIELVNQQVGKPYSVNLRNGERYLTYLKSSQLLTDTYLNQWRTYFKERQEGFRLSPQTEGPPTGFDYDLVMLNQDVDIQLAALNSLKVMQVNVTKERATVTFILFDTYAFRLVRGKDRWLINEIINQSQE